MKTEEEKFNEQIEAMKKEHQEEIKKLREELKKSLSPPPNPPNVKRELFKEINAKRCKSSMISDLLSISKKGKSYFLGDKENAILLDENMEQKSTEYFGDWGKFLFLLPLD